MARPRARLAAVAAGVLLFHSLVSGAPAADPPPAVPAGVTALRERMRALREEPAESRPSRVSGDEGTTVAASLFPGVRLVSATPNGYALATRVDGPRLFAATTHGIEIYDRTGATGTGLTRLGGLPRAMGAVGVDARGRWAAGIDWDQAWFLVDVADPARPVEVATAAEGDPLAEDVAVGSTFAAIADADGIRIFSLLSGSPSETVRLDAPGPLRADGNRLLAGDGSYWRLLDPARPVRICGPQRTAPAPMACDVDFEAGIAVFTKPTEVWSYANPSAPQLLATLPEEAVLAAIDGGRLYLQGWNAPARNRVYSLASPSAPLLLGEAETGGTWGLGIDAAGSRLWQAGSVAWGVETVDVSDPAAMTSLGDTRDGVPVYVSASVDGRWLAALDGSGTPRLFDVLDPTVQSPVALPGAQAGAVSVAVVDDWLVTGPAGSPGTYLVTWELGSGTPDLVGMNAALSTPLLGEGFFAAQRRTTGETEVFRLAPGVPPQSLGLLPVPGWPLVAAGTRIVAQSHDPVTYRRSLSTWETSGGMLESVGDAPSPSEWLSAGHGETVLVESGGCTLICWSDLLLLDLVDPSHPIPIGFISTWGQLAAIGGGRILVIEQNWSSLPTCDLRATRPGSGGVDPLLRALLGGDVAFDPEAGLIAVASEDQLRLFDVSGWLNPEPCAVLSNLVRHSPAGCLTAERDIATLSARTVSGDGCEGNWLRSWTLDGAVVPGATGPTFRAPAGLAMGAHTLSVTASCATQPGCAPVSASTTFGVDTAVVEVTNLRLEKAPEVGFGSVRLSWDPLPEAFSYDLEKSLPPFTTWARQSTFGGPRTTAEFTSWSWEADVRFRLLATNGCGVGP